MQYALAAWAENPPRHCIPAVAGTHRRHTVQVCGAFLLLTTLPHPFLGLHATVSRSGASAKEIGNRLCARAARLLLSVCSAHALQVNAR